MPAIVEENVVVGVAWLYIHPTAGTAKPSFDDTPSGGWVYIGATQEGVTVSDEVEINDLYVEESMNPIISTPGTGAFTISAQLAESTLENIQLCMGGTISGSVLTLSSSRPYIA